MISALYLVNPNSSRAAQFDKEARAALEELGVEILACPETEIETTLGWIRQQASTADCIIVGGGDGSMHALAPALLAADKPVGLLPMGTANDLATAMGIPEDMAGACQVIANGHSQRIDVATVNDEPFFNVVHIGIAAETQKRMTGERKKWLGVMSYPLSIMETMQNLRPFRAIIEDAEGSVHRWRSVQVSIGNGPRFGGGMVVSRKARIDDGLLDLFSIKPAPFWQRLRLAPSMPSGEHIDDDQVSSLRGAQFKLRCSRNLRVTADGEFIGRTPLELKVLPAALTLFTPAQEQTDADE